MRIPEPAQQTEKYKVRGLANDDPGYADFVRLSFSIFSPTIESLSLTYLSLFVISAILFIIAMRGDPFYLGLVTLFAAVHYLLFKSNLFGSVGRSPLLGEFADPTISFVTPSSAHFLTVLAILPLFHSLALFCRKVPITFGQAFCLAGQGLIAGFVIYARSSALWVLLAAAFVPLAARLLWGRRETRANGSRTGTESFFRIVARTGSQYWAVILFLAVAVLTNAGLQTTLHPLYNSGGSVSRHAFWTEVWYGLQYHPDWLHKYGETYKLNGRVALQDDLPIAAVLNYLERHPPPADRQVYDDTGWLRWRVVNDYAFSAFLQFARSDPLFVLQAFQYKLLGNIHKLSWAVVEVFGNRSDLDYALLIFLLLGVAITASRFGQPVESDGWKYLVMAFIAAALSVSPSVATLSRWQLMSDGIYLTSFALLLLMTFMVTALIHRLRFSLLPDRLPLWLMRRPITFATAGGAIRSSKILPIFGCIVIAALLSSAALMLVKRVQAPSSWVVSAAEAPTNLADLPPLSNSRFAWLDIAGMPRWVIFVLGI